MGSPEGSGLNRRRVLKLGALAGLGGAGYAAYRLGPWSNPLGANADIRLGIIGLRGKGSDHRKNFDDIPGCRITALCDCDTEFLDREQAELGGSGKVKAYSDYRKLLESGNVDAVVVATPNHWHAVMGVHALQAGKHLYIEKPVAFSIAEGERLLEEARKHPELVVQTGTQRRSDQAYAEAREWLAGGELGKIIRIRCVVYRQRDRLIKRKSPAPLPATLDYDRWCGPAAREELYRSRVHYDWHWRWNTGNGELGNNGIHFIDAARMILADPGLPPLALSIGGRLGWGEDSGETPNTHIVGFPGEVPIFCEVRNLPTKPRMKAMDHLNGLREGIVVECEDGVLAWPQARATGGKRLKKFSSQDGHGHRVNWLKAIVDAQPGAVNAPLEQGLISTAYCHLGNIAHRSGSPMTGEPPADDRLAGLDSLLEHLGRHAVDLKATPLISGEANPGDAPAWEREHRPAYSF